MMPLTRAERIATLAAILMGGMLMAFLAGLWLGSHRTATPLPPTSTPPALALPALAAPDHPLNEIPPAISPVEATPDLPTTSTDAALTRLLVTQRSLEEARDILRKAKANNKGGNVEVAREDVDRALSHLNEAFTYLQTHPEIPPFTSAKGPPAGIPDLQATAMPALIKGGAPNLVTALRSLNAALTPLIDPASPCFGELGGYRNKILEDINQACIDVRKGMEVVGVVAPGR